MGSIQAMIKNGQLQKTINETLNWNYICCFSYNAVSPAMWAHYCNNHTGLCLGFDSKIGGPFLDGIKGVVKYNNKQTEFDWTNIGKENCDTKSFFFEKASEWEYEEEFRVVKHLRMIEEHPDSYNVFKKEALVAMFFGLRMPKDRQKFYMNLCKLCGFNDVVFHKMTMPTDGTYHLKPVEIKSGKDSDA